MGLTEDKAEQSSPGETLIKDKAKVELVELGEGYEGDYDPDDPKDVELLRFDVSALVENEEDADSAENNGGELGWTPKRDSSYCTQLPVSLTTQQRDKALQLIMKAVYQPIMEHASIKRLCERLSWIEPSWLDSEDPFAHIDSSFLSAFG